MRFSVVALLAAAATTTVAIDISGAPACAVCCLHAYALFKPYSNLRLDNSNLVSLRMPTKAPVTPMQQTPLASVPIPISTT